MDGSAQIFVLIYRTHSFNHCDIRTRGFLPFFTRIRGSCFAGHMIKIKLGADRLGIYPLNENELSAKCFTSA